MSVWRSLFIDDEEYAPAINILSGLHIEHVGVRPHGAAHSIYEELWHIKTWQNLVLDRDEAAYGRWQQGEKFPASSAPIDEATWHQLVIDVLDGLDRAVSLAEDKGALETTFLFGFGVREMLERLAIHNAYHLGKIVLLRQLLGLWTPPPDDAQA